MNTENDTAGGSQSRRYNGRRTPPRMAVVFDRYESPLYFVTFCTARRRKILANPVVHDTFRRFAERGYHEQRVAVGRYVIMPDHLHVFVAGGREFNLPSWVRMLKTVLGKTLVAQGEQPEFWQRGFFDHLLRQEESYAEKWEYVWQNPVRAGLVTRAEDWPYQGEVVALECR